MPVSTGDSEGRREPFADWPVRPRVLIVDDDPTDRALLRAQWMAQHGTAYDIIEAPDIEEGHHPDAIALDMHLMTTSGAETTAKAGRIYPGVPVVKMSGAPDDASTLRKDDAAEIVSAVNKLLVPRFQALAEAQAPAAPVVDPPETAPVSWASMQRMGAAVAVGGSCILWLMTYFHPAAVIDRRFGDQDEQLDAQQEQLREHKSAFEAHKEAFARHDRETHAQNVAVQAQLRAIAVRLGLPPVPPQESQAED